MYCKYCGCEINHQCDVCPNCGKSLYENSNQNLNFDNFYSNSNNQNNASNNQNYQQNQSQNYNQSKQPVEGDTDSPFMYGLLGFFLPMVGLILGIIWYNEFPIKAKACLKGFIVATVLGFVFGFIAIILSFVMAGSMLHSVSNYALTQLINIIL